MSGAEIQGENRFLQDSGNAGRSGRELRTPIDRIIARCERVLKGVAPSESYFADLERIIRSSRNLLSLLETGLGAEDSGDRTDEEWRRVLHDLRTPVNHIVGYAEMLSEDAAGEGLEDLTAEFDQIHGEARNWLSRMEERLPGAGREKEPSQDLIDQLNETVISDAAESAEVAPKAETARILVVDDDETNRDLLRRRLAQQGYQVETAPDGETCLRRLAGENFEMVLLDMLMPGLNGVEVLTRMKADTRLREIPVIVISALDDEAGIARCIELGAEDYLSKPFYPAVLRARIGTGLEKRRLRAAEKKHLAEIQEERRKSDRLLLNILPEAVADRLKSGEEKIADHFAEVTVLFADLVDFTVLSSESSPERVVGILNGIFSAFDRNAERHGLEKIKTIGDAYMAVGGLPQPLADHAAAVAAFALDLMDDLDRMNGELDTKISLRVGIDTGPVIAGIVGINKFIYDLWGDTVNTASRMESHGEPGRIQVTERTRGKLDGRFELTSRGEIEVKGKGPMKTWFLERKAAPGG